MSNKFGVTFYLNSGESDEESKRICSCKTTRIAEWVKLLKYCKDNDIEFFPHSADSGISDDMYEKLSCASFVKDFYVVFGSDTIPGIEVYLE